MLGGIIGGAAGALGGIFGGISKNRMLREQARMVNEQKRENQDWYDRRYNEDATQRADAQAILTQTADMIKRRNQQSAGAQAVMGGTEESAAAAKEANAKALSDAVSQIAVAGEQRKDQIEGQYLNRRDALNAHLRELRGQRQDGFQMASNAIGGGINGFAAGMGYEEDYDKQVKK
jgi:hypothetical protein